MFNTECLTLGVAHIVAHIYFSFLFTMIKKIHFRALCSLALLVLFAIVTFTSIGLYFAPAGKIARLSNWTFLGLSKGQLVKLHTISGFVMVGIIIIHLILNWRLFSGELKSFRVSKAK